jgi:hypothetical protein
MDDFWAGVEELERRIAAVKAAAEQCRGLGVKTNPRLQKQAGELVGTCWALAAPHRSVTFRLSGDGYKPAGNLAWRKVAERDTRFEKNSRGEMAAARERLTTFWETTVPIKDLGGVVEVGGLVSGR